MRVLTVVAVEYEAKAMAGPGNAGEHRIGPYRALVPDIDGVDMDVIVGGVGPAAAAAATAAGLALGGAYDLVVSAGIAGGFRSRGVDLADVVVASEIVPADLGLHLDDGLMDPVQLEWLSGPLLTDPGLSELFVQAGRARRGPIVTVGTMTGTDLRAEELAARHPEALAEAMEGAGVAIAATQWGVPFAEVRVISNFVGRYNKKEWAKDRALDALTEVARSFASLAAESG